MKQNGKNVQIKWIIEDSGQDNIIRVYVELSRNFSIDFFYDYFTGEMSIFI